MRRFHGQLAPQRPHSDADGLGEWVGVLVPPVVEQLLGRDDVLGPVHEVAQRAAAHVRAPSRGGRHAELLAGQPQLAGAAASGAAPVVEDDLAELQHGGGGGGVAAQQHADASQELTKGERLDQIVVGALVQAADAVAQVAPGGQQQHGFARWSRF
jgi:hypothetical protein